MKTFKLTIREKNKKKTLSLDKGTLISKVLQDHGISLDTPCGGYGSCGKCRIRYLSSPPESTPAEKKNIPQESLDHGIRLACQHHVTEDLKIKIEGIVTQKGLHILSDGIELESELNPDIPGGIFIKNPLGLAVDIGTTTLVVTLHNLKSGKRLGIRSRSNPQSKYGTDIISRANAATESAEDAKTLQELIIKAINHLIRDLTKHPKDIVHVVMAGNTVMTHILLGLSIDSLVTAPYIAPVTDLQILEGADSGLAMHPRGKVTVLPGIGSFIGGDIAADLLVCREILPQNATYLLMDLGTNCEIVLKTPEFSVASSAPAGPVMEGAGITCGMQAEPGAVSDLFFNGKGRFQAVTIDNQAVSGICGSGLIHSIHTLWKQMLITDDGRFVEKIPRKGFRIDRHVYLSPQDIRAYQMAKGAIAATRKMLLQDAGLSPQDLDFLVLAGGFGHYIRPDAGMETGIFPSLPEDAFKYLGNGSLAGCELILKNKDYVFVVQQLAEETNHSELAGRPDFQEIYVMNMGVTRDEVQGGNLPQRGQRR
ncbi:TPA: hypothetical protein DCG86_05560 [Candidatus Marinimicrobia bacterium]|nr:MAG: Ferredoxin [Marinimicrobia bacterium 46_43]HAE87473.1 hypothetical protein [Candidatus Neomarinimicrobiota bacterium]